MTGRRSAGESTIFQTPDGRWHGFVSMGTKAGGRRDRRHVSGQKRADVVRKVQALTQKREAGVITAAPRGSTFGQWLDHWLTTIAAARVRPSTYVGYESKIRVHIKPALGHHQLERLQPEHLEAFYAAMVATGSSPSTALICHRIVARSLKVGLQRGRVARNVALLVDPPSATSAEVVPLTEAEARRVLKAAAGTRNAARWSVALSLGLRQGEALGARWADVDLEHGVWRVRQQMRRLPYRHGCGEPREEGGKRPCGEVKPSRCSERTGGVTWSEPKTARGKRNIGLPPQLLAALKAHRQAQLEERLAAGSEWEENDLVFAQVTGKPIDSRKDWGSWRDLLVLAKVRHARLHDARHTAATLLLAQNVAPRVVMEILGHSTIAVTQNVYQHVMPEAVSAATAAVEASLLTRPATALAPKANRRRRG